MPKDFEPFSGEEFAVFEEVFRRLNWAAVLPFTVVGINFCNGFAVVTNGALNVIPFNFTLVILLLSYQILVPIPKVMT